MAFKGVFKLSELGVGKMKKVDVGGKALVVVNYDGEYYALDDTCSHAECSLSEGWLEGKKLVCPCHGSQFDFGSGEPMTLPAIMPIKVYRTRIVGKSVEVDTDL